MFAYIRLGLTVVWVLLTFTYRVIGIPFRFVSPGVDEFFRRTAFKACARGVLRCMGVRLIIEGKRPEPPFYLVTNHISFVDIFVLAAELGCVFVSKSEVGNWPVAGFITRNMKTIYINRSTKRDTHRVNLEITNVMKSGLGVVAFPEATTTPNGYMLPFKPALLQAAVDLGMPLRVASLWYGTPEDPGRGLNAILWKDGVSTARHFLNIAGLGGCECRVVFGEETVTAADRRELAVKVQEAVGRIHTPME